MNFSIPEFERSLGDPSTKSGNKTQKITLKWRNINLSLKRNSKSLAILRDISGYANPNEILAIMGLSGCGKTSLLSILSNQFNINSSYTLSGSLNLNDVDYSKTNPNRFIRFIAQEDDLYDFLTPLEIFEFFGGLESSLKKEQLKERIKNIIHDLKLEKVSNSIVGNKIFKGLSGGEKKRVSIGLNLISDPSVLILDEPTSGLDSFIALSLMKIIKETSKSGITIILTIHQPSRAIFQLFDRLVLMHEGSFVYQGLRQDSLNYFESIECPIPLNMNPCDHFIKVLSANLFNISSKELKIQNLDDSYSKFKPKNSSNDSTYMKHFIEGSLNIKPESLGLISDGIKNLYENYETIKPDILSVIDAATQKGLNYKREFKSPYSKIMTILLKKTIISMKRNPIVIVFKIFQAIFVGLFIAVVFRDLGHDEIGVQDRRGALIYIMLNITILNVILYSICITNEKEVLLKHKRNELYGFNSYFFTMFSIEAFLAIPTSIIFTLIIYWTVGFNYESGSKVLIFMLLIYLALMHGVIYGILAASVSKTIISALFIGPTIAMIQAVIGSIFTNPKSVPENMSWLKYCSALYFVRTAFYKNEFDDLDIKNVKIKIHDEFGIERSIAENILYSIVTSTFSYFISLFIFWVSLRRRLVKISH